MTQKLIVAFGIVGVLALGAGLGVGRATAPASAQAAMEKYDLVARADLEAMKARYEEARNDLEKLQAEKLEIVKARDDLAGQLEAKAAKAKAAEAEKLAAAARGRSKIPLAFGKYAELSEIQNADWAAMAEATSNMNVLLADFAERKKKGQPPAVDWQMKMVEENNKLLKFAVGIMGKLPTHRTGNGEYTHPVVLANLMASMLDRAEMPLSDEQRAGIMALGNEFESEYARFQSSYSGDTLMLEKIVDELALKRDIIDRMQALLTTEQRDLLVNPDLHHRTGMDLLSPMLMTIASIEARTAGSRDEARSQVTKILSDKYELSGDLLAAAQESLDTFLQDLDPLLEPVADPGIPAHVDQAVAAARAEISFLKSLLALPNLSEMTRAAILNEITWILPQVAKRQEGAKEGEAKQPGGDAKQ